MGTIHYLANGPKSIAKERLEVFSEGKVLPLDHFRSLVGYSWPGFKKKKLWSQDKGQQQCVEAFVDAIRKGESSPTDFNEILEVTRTTLEMDLKGAS